MANRLAQAQSLYLRKHAENPIDWWPWGEEALEKAKRESKPIFLSIGYSSCHWCTVMEGEAFSDPDIAAYMNSHFVPIKVDREERPDLDSIYMQALQMMTGQGGWPLNIFLTPGDLVPFIGGTYFPVEPRYGRPGFLELLQRIRQYYDAEPEPLEQLKDQLLGGLQQSALLPKGSELGWDLVQRGLSVCTQVVAAKGPGPRFPMIPYGLASLASSRFPVGEGGRAIDNSRSVCEQRGLDLALGGIYDHVAGGFHRYTVDATWTVPHFEKMLYDNGQIMEYLAHLWSAGFQEAAFQRAIAGTVEWLQREMVAPEGYFYAAQDADSFVSAAEGEPEEGAFYGWRYGELEALLNPEDLAAILSVFTVTVDGNFEGQNVLQRYQGGVLDGRVESALAQLFAVRYGATPDRITPFPPARDNGEAKGQNWPGRIPPVTDTKMIVAWNSLMISGLARAAVVWQEPTYGAIARRAAQYILDHQWVEGRFCRLNYGGQPGIPAQAEDYALFVKALLDLQQAALGLGERDGLSETNWLAEAVRIQAEMDDRLWSVELGGYYNTGGDACQDLLVRERSYGDNATPAANGVAIANLIRLSLLQEDLQYLERAEQGLLAFSVVMERSPQACPSLLNALDWFYQHTLVRTSPEQIAQLMPQYWPTVVFKLDPERPEGCVGLVCQGLSCLEPAQSTEQLVEQLRHSQVRHSQARSL